MRKPGLWHGPRRVEIEAVNARMAKPCSACGDLPEERRVHVVEGVGRSGATSIYCMTCGDRWLRDRLIEAKRARRYLRTGEGTVRRGTRPA